MSVGQACVGCLERLGLLVCCPNGVGVPLSGLGRGGRMKVIDGAMVRVQDDEDDNDDDGDGS